LVLLFASGCRTAYYGTMEKFGVYKRDILKKRVVEARDEQAEAGEQFKDALTRLKEMTGYDGGKLEQTYRELQSDYDSAAEQAEVVRKRIRDVETVAQDLFNEWEKEIAEISTPSLQSASRQQLNDTRRRYQELHTALISAEQAMEPVLVKFKDYVLYLKHNLNAAAVATLKGEATSIQGEISRLIDEMNKSIAKADAFVKEME
jgi:hypothetical protein